MNSENGALVEFYTDAVQNNFRSKQEGRPIFEDRVFVRIQTPGDTRTTINREATDQDKARFPKSWSAFEQGLSEVTEGTPLAQWTAVSASQVKELAHVHVRTVDQLAALSDASIQRMGPGYQQLRQQARHYLENAQDGAKATEVQRENDDLREENALLKEQIKALKAQVKALESDAKEKDESAPKRGPGRPPKSESQE